MSFVATKDKPLTAVILAGGKKRLGKVRPRTIGDRLVSALSEIIIWLFCRLTGSKEDKLTKPLPGEVQGWDIQLGNNERCVDRVIQAVRGCPLIGRIGMVASEVPKGLFDVEILSPVGETLGDSLRAGLRLVKDPNEMLVFIGADLPLSEADDLTQAIRKCNRPADLYIGYITEECSNEQYPDWPRTWVKLRDKKSGQPIQLCSGGIVIVRAKHVERIAKEADALYRWRKFPLLFAAWIGALHLRLLFLFVIGRCTPEDAELAFSMRFGIPVVVIEVASSLGHDIDDYKRLELAKKYAALRRATM